MNGEQEIKSMRAFQLLHEAIEHIYTAAELDPDIGDFWGNNGQDNSHDIAVDLISHMMDGILDRTHLSHERIMKLMGADK